MAKHRKKREGRDLNPWALIISGSRLLVMLIIGGMRF